MTQLIWQRGAIHWVEFATVGKKSHTLAQEHPAVIISNNKQNQFSSVITVLPITSQLDKIYPFELLIQLEKPSKILLDQITTIDKVYVKKRIDSLTAQELLHLTLAFSCYEK